MVLNMKITICVILATINMILCQQEPSNIIDPPISESQFQFEYAI